MNYRLKPSFRYGFSITSKPKRYKVTKNTFASERLMIYTSHSHPLTFLEKLIGTKIVLGYNKGILYINKSNIFKKEYQRKEENYNSKSWRMPINHLLMSAV